ncbi:DUF1573 domain-containing protein [Stieleria varia]|uniref:DUF1573 domain-containing protein n=1 Tax=Stieleria varia TaxID=2528005 RepID=A0A5C6A0H7_9BACT|nr:DUF1573 domain-containing protein [Stieleria varia]TWT92801.1 hypothetical protein Pla52n_61660 [Stieleria varia]
MNTFAKRFSWFLAFLLVFACVTAAFALTVTYKPFGVPDSRRAEYEAKLTALKQRKEKLQQVKELGEAARPKVSLKKRSHDFGMIDPHTTESHTFTIGNTGTDPLTLTLRETSCKCTVGDLKDGLVMPGEETTVTLTWNTGYQAEKYRQTAVLVTNDPEHETIELAVVGEVRAKFIAPDSIGFNKTDPGVETDSRFVVFSQLWEDFVIEDVRADREPFEWHAEPIDNSAPELADKYPRSAWKLNLFTSTNSHEDYTGKLTLVVRPADGSETIEHEIQYKGTVRAPINFYSPDIHMEQGLEIGTLDSSKEHRFHLICRVRGDISRHVEVLDIEPKQLRAELTPTTTEGSYRLSIIVPKDCPMVTFNADEKHGYVQVGDPQNHDFSNWFPLMGAVVDLDQR